MKKELPMGVARDSKMLLQNAHFVSLQTLILPQLIQGLQKDKHCETDDMLVLCCYDCIKYACSIQNSFQQAFEPDKTL